ncbi:hypothetical protein [Flavobacterium oreochromis]|uniref:hypothetical protein n=1 Tax=Flavobacterium oreochromis TaxID=2906078 RepID=UPI00385B4E03
MKQLATTFEIDEQFKNWEFDLEFYKTHIAKNKYRYEIYYYLKSSVDTKVYLAFNCDFIVGVFQIYKIAQETNYCKNNNHYNFIKIKNSIIQFKTKRNWKIAKAELNLIFGLDC